LKAWYERRNRCSRCFGDATAISVPNSWLTYVIYGLYVIAPALAAVYLTTDVRPYIWLSLGGVIIMIVVSFVDVSRGAAYAKKRIKVTDGDLQGFRKRGWR